MVSPLLAPLITVIMACSWHKLISIYIKIYILQSIYHALKFVDLLFSRHFAEGSSKGHDLSNFT
jgi:hypothetical protein